MALGRIKEPTVGSIGLIVNPKFFEKPLGKQRVTIFATFSLIDPNLHAGTVDMIDFQVGNFAQPQACRVGGH